MFPALAAASMGAGAAAGAGAAGSGLGFLGGLGAVGQGLSGMSSIANTITGLIGMGRQSPQQHLEERQFERMQEPVGQAFQQLFYNPMMQEGLAPYSGVAYRWAPTDATKQIYSSYLNRQYGLPQNIAAGMRSQAMQPLKMGNLPGNMTNPAAIAQGMRQDPGQMAQSMLGREAPDVMRQQSYLQGAGELSAYNLWRMQQLPSMIG